MADESVVVQGKHEERLAIIEANLEELRNAHSTNMDEIQRAFILNDINVQLLQRMSYDLGLRTGGELNVTAYRDEYRRLVTSVSAEDAEKAVKAWVNGATVEVAIDQCRESGLNSTLPPPGPPGESLYEEHYFGGNYGKNTDQ